MSKRVTSSFLAVPPEVALGWVELGIVPSSISLGTLMVSILIQSTGQTRSHCKQPMQSSISTCSRERITLYWVSSNPMWRSGMGHFSRGYCRVALSVRLLRKCHRVTRMPSTRDAMVTPIFLKYALISDYSPILC